jgi:hypothetical protein
MDEWQLEMQEIETGRWELSSRVPGQDYPGMVRRLAG